mgnify:CR=1 FL=1
MFSIFIPPNFILVNESDPGGVGRPNFLGRGCLSENFKGELNTKTNLFLFESIGIVD